MNGPISIAWNGYKAVAVPLGASDAQIAETKRAFYAGTLCTLGMCVGTKDLGELIELAKTLKYELAAFNAERKPEVQH